MNNSILSFEETIADISRNATAVQAPAICGQEDCAEFALYVFGDRDRQVLSDLCAECCENIIVNLEPGSFYLSRLDGAQLHILNWVRMVRGLSPESSSVATQEQL